VQKNAKSGLFSILHLVCVMLCDFRLRISGGGTAVVPLAMIEVSNEMAEQALVANDAEQNVGETGNIRRRDFINIGALAFGGVGVGTIVIPLVSQMAPSADVLAEATTEIDLAAITEGQAIKAFFQKQPLFVRHLTAKEIADANAVDASSLRDPQSLAERTREGKSQWLVTLGVCTHLGCVPLGASEGEAKGEYGGYFCPCHGSHYDTAARVRKGPAPLNLVVPDYVFRSDTTIEVGVAS
jgi:ubiquinol-cytochrome c reductase iron-sulfur subunit